MGLSTLTSGPKFDPWVGAKEQSSAEPEWCGGRPQEG